MMLNRRLYFVATLIFLLFLSNNMIFASDECTRLNHCTPITVDDAEQLAQIATLGWGSILDLTWLPDGQVLAVGAATGVWLYDPSTPESRPTQIINQGGVTSVDYSAKEDIFLTTSFDQTVILWDATSGEELRRLTQHSDTTNQARFIDEGKLIISADNDGRVMIWNIETDSQVLLTQLESVTANAIDYHGDSSIIAVANSVDGTSFCLMPSQATLFL